MKFSLFNSASIASILLFTTTINASPANSSLRGLKQQQQEVSHHRVLEEDQEGVFLIAEVEGDERDASGSRRNLQGNSNKDKQTFNVEFTDGTIYEIKNAATGWADGLTSGSDTVKIPRGAIVSGAEIDVKGGKPEGTPGNAHGLFDRNLGEESRTPEQERNLAELNRQLAVVTGTKTVLAVRVVHTGAGAKGGPTDGIDTIRDDIFGTSAGGADTQNLHSQYLACSHGKLDFQPQTTQPRSPTLSYVSNIDNGMVEVTVDSVDCSTNSCDGNLRNAVNSALGTAFGTQARNLADHVMHCLPPNTMSGIAYAYVNSWNSVYKDRWCQYTSAQLHELGHNLNLAHSGETQTYDDQTGFMGYSYSIDDQPMCFNNAKNHQLGWFTGAEVSISQGESFSGNLKGQINYPTASTTQPVIVEIRNAAGQTSSDLNWYVGYNHDAGFHSDTREGKNQVTIQSYRATGGYAVSTLIAKIASGTSWTGTLGDVTATVDVGTITTGTSSGVAPVTITYGAPATPNPTSPPTTANPTSPPTTANPTSPPTPGPTKSPVPPTMPPTNAPTNVPTAFPTGTPTVFSCSNFNESQCSQQTLCEWQNKGPNKYCKDAEGVSPSPPSPSPPSPSPPTPDECTPGSGGRNAQCSADSDCASCNCKANNRCSG